MDPYDRWSGVEWEWVEHLSRMRGQLANDGSLWSLPPTDQRSLSCLRSYDRGYCSLELSLGGLAVVDRKRSS